MACCMKRTEVAAVRQIIKGTQWLVNLQCARLALICQLSVHYNCLDIYCINCMTLAFMHTRSKY